MSTDAHQYAVAREVNDTKIWQLKKNKCRVCDNRTCKSSIINSVIFVVVKSRLIMLVTLTSKLFVKG